MMREDIITAWAAEQGFTLRAEQMRLFKAFQERLLAENENINLTAITEAADIAVKHFIDSLTLLPWIPHGARLIDIGTGAGFPGVPLLIARPDISVTFLDSLRKRVLFLQDTLTRLGLTQGEGRPGSPGIARAECFHGRGEEFARKPAFKGCYDISTARAVAGLDVLAKYALPFIKPGGRFLAMKGPAAEAEAARAQAVIAKRGGKVTDIARVRLAEGLVHSIVVIEKKGD